jgi:hypothetical protein
VSYAVGCQHRQQPAVERVLELLELVGNLLARVVGGVVEDAVLPGRLRLAQDGVVQRVEELAVEVVHEEGRAELGRLDVEVAVGTLRETCS